MATASMISVNTVPTELDDFDSELLLALVRKRREEGEYVLYLLEQERNDEGCKKKYLDEKSKREGLEKKLERTHVRKLEAFIRPQIRA